MDLPKADIKFKDNSWIIISGKEGTLEYKKNILQIKGGIDIFTNNGSEFHTVSAVYLFSEGIIEGKEEVVLHGSWGSLKGTGFRYGTSDRILKVFGNPSMVLYSNR